MFDSTIHCACIINYSAKVDISSRLNFKRFCTFNQVKTINFKNPTP
jgi:hypothetical protein